MCVNGIYIYKTDGWKAEENSTKEISKELRALSSEDSFSWTAKARPARLLDPAAPTFCTSGITVYSRMARVDCPKSAKALFTDRQRKRTRSNQKRRSSLVHPSRTPRNSRRVGQLINGPS